MFPLLCATRLTMTTRILFRKTDTTLGITCVAAQISDLASVLLTVQSLSLLWKQSNRIGKDEGSTPQCECIRRRAGCFSIGQVVVLLFY